MKTLKIEAISTEELKAELYRREHGDKRTLAELESSIEISKRESSVEAFETRLRELSKREGKGPQPCPRCGRVVPVNGAKRSRQVTTLHGVVKYERNYHYCRGCRQGFAPLDEALGLRDGVEMTEALERRLVDFGMNEPYGRGCERFSFHYGFSVSTCLLHRSIGRLPLPEFESAPEVDVQGRLTVQVDGSMVPMQAGWQEAKVAVVVSDEHYSRGTETHRGCVTEANYVATMEDVEGFGRHLKRVLPPRIPVKERKKPHAEVVWVGDGAAWVWNLQKRLCPTAIPILDWTHAVQHAHSCAQVLFSAPKQAMAWTEQVKSQLYEGQVCTVLEQLTQQHKAVRSPEKREALRLLIGYYAEHQTRMNYREHRDKGRMIGSGIVESAHRHVLQARMKRSGQHWSPSGAERMVRLRALYCTHGPDRFYDAVTNTNHRNPKQKMAA